MGCLIDERNVSRVLDYLCMHAQYPKVTLLGCLFLYNLFMNFNFYVKQLKMKIIPAKILRKKLQKKMLLQKKINYKEFSI